MLNVKKFNTVMFIFSFLFGIGIANVITANLEDVSSYLLKMRIGGVIIDSSSPTVLTVPGKLTEHNKIWVNTSPNAFPLEVNGSVDMWGKIMIDNNNLSFPVTDNVIFAKSWNYNFSLSNIVVSRVWWPHVNIGEVWGAGLLNINWNLRVYWNSSIVWCNANNVWVIKWNGSRLIVCEAKTDFYGRPLNWQYERHQLTR